MWDKCGREEVHTLIWSENLRERDHLENLGLDGRTMLKWIFNKWDGLNKLDWSGSRYRQMAGCSEYSNEPPIFVKYAEFLV